MEDKYQCEIYEGGSEMYEEQCIYLDSAREEEMAEK